MSSATNSITLSESQIKRLEKSQSMFQIVLKQFFEHKMAVAGCFVILFFIVIALAAPLIEMATGINPNAQNVFNRYKPPFTMAVASTDAKETAVSQFTQIQPEAAAKVRDELIAKNLVISAKPEDVLFDLVNKDRKEALEIIEKLEAPEASNLSKMIRSFETYHVFGTDELGRDVFMRVVYGARVSIGVGVLVAIVSALIGLLIGALAGFYGGLIDTALMRVTDALLSLPLLPVLIVVAAIDLTKVPFLKAIMSAQNESIYKLVFILCIFSWMTVARLVRGAILSLREREFILAARTLGATDWTIITRHMFPNVIAPMLVSVTLGVGESILFEAALSFLGLGIQPPTPSWGNMLFNAQELIYQAPFLAILPGVLIFFTVISFNFLGDGLQDAIDPKSIRR